METIVGTIQESVLDSSCMNYLNESGILLFIEQRCRVFQHFQDKAFEFLIPIDIHNLIEYDAHLGNMVLNQPEQAFKTFQRVVYFEIHSRGFLPQCQAIDQVSVRLKLDMLPSLPGYHMVSSREFTNLSKHKNMIQYNGIIIGMSTVLKYTKSARFVCGSDKDCEGAEGDKFIRYHVISASETQTIRNDLMCTFCGGTLVEDVSSRVLADKLVMEIMDEEALLQQPQRCRSQCLTAYLKDELVANVEIGQRVTVIGVPVKGKILALEVINLLEHEYAMKIPIDICVSCLPESIVSLLNDRKSSRWSFGFSLAYAFAGGSLLLASRGICLIPDTSYIKKKTKELLVQVLETDLLNVETMQPSGVSRSLLTFQRKCQIWSYMDPATEKRNQNLESDQPPGGNFTKDKKAALLANMFSMIFYVDTKPDSYADHLIQTDILSKAMNNISSEPLVSDADFAMFLDYAQQLEVTLTSEAQRLIQRYYIASRRVRAFDDSSSSMPRTAVKTLTILTEAYAKLNLRQEANEFDALMAVYLHEEMMTCKTGHSVIGIKPSAHVEDGNLQANIGPLRDEKMFQLYQQLTHFLNLHALDIGENQQLEE